MKVLMSIPTEVYDGLLAKCSMMSREYLILKNGVVIRDQDRIAKQDMVEILCEHERAKFLLDFVTIVFPDAASAIENSIVPSAEED
jgi:sulfur carrier protein ThiS